MLSGNGISLVLASLLAAAITCNSGVVYADDASDFSAKTPVVELNKVLADDSRHYSQRRAAAYQLGLRGEEAAVAIPALVKSLDDRQLEMVWYAMDTLGRIGPPAKSAVPAMVKAMQDPANDAVLRLNAAAALARLGPAAEAAVPSLVESLQHEEASFRVAAAVALWKIAQDRRGLALLHAELNSDDSEAVFHATSGTADLGEINDSLAEEVARLLGHRVGDVRRAAARTLANQGPAGAERIIAAARARPSSRPKLEAAIAALRWLGEETRETIFLDSTTEQADYLIAARPLLRHALPFLLDVTGSGDEAIRQQATDAISSYGLISLTDLVKEISLGVERGQAERIAALELLTDQLPPPEAELPAADMLVRRRAIEPLVAAMADEQVDVRRAAVRAFAALEISEPGEAATEQLRLLLRDTDLRVRRHAAEALGG